jgi:hypothetical protein
VDYLGYRLAWARYPKSGDDEDAAGLGERVSGRRLGLGRVPGARGRGDVPRRRGRARSWRWPGSELERDGALYGAGGAVGACPVQKACQASSITTPMLHLTRLTRTFNRPESDLVVVSGSGQPSVDSRSRLWYQRTAAVPRQATAKMVQTAITAAVTALL